MATVATREPGMFTSGDTLVFKRVLTSYQAGAGWSLHYTLTNTSGQTKAEFDSEADGSDHLISVDDFAAELPAGDYLLSGFAVKDEERHQIYLGWLTLGANLGQSTTDVRPVQTHAQKMIALLEAQLEELAANNLQETDVNRSRFRLVQRKEIQDQLKWYYHKRAEEVMALLALNGRAPGNVVAPFFMIG